MRQWIDKRRQSLDWMQRFKGPYYELFQPPVAISRRPPLCASSDKIHPAFSVERYHIQNEVFLARIPDARILGPSGVVVTPDGGAVEESTWVMGWLERDRLFKSWKLPRPVTQHGHYYTIASLYSYGYAHWILDALPRLFGLERLPADEIQTIVSEPLKSWQKESLAMLGLDNMKLIALDHRHLQLDVLYFPSYVGGPGNPHPWACQWLRSYLLKGCEPGRSRRRIYITRRLAERRRIANEDELEPILSKNGFEIIEAERLSFREQVCLFSQAEAVVALHGAGLTNLLFAPPGCKVLEIFDPNHMKVMYYALADVLDQRYWYIVGQAAGLTNLHHQITGHDDVYVPPSDFAQSLTAILQS